MWSRKEDIEGKRPKKEGENGKSEMKVEGKGEKEHDQNFGPKSKVVRR